MSIFILKVTKYIENKFSNSIKGIFKDEDDAIKYREIIFKQELELSSYNIVSDYQDNEYEIENNGEYLKVTIDEIPEDHLSSYCKADRKSVV